MCSESRTCDCIVRDVGSSLPLAGTSKQTFRSRTQDSPPSLYSTVSLGSASQSLPTPRPASLPLPARPLVLLLPAAPGSAAPSLLHPPACIALAPPDIPDPAVRTRLPPSAPPATLPPSPPSAPSGYPLAPLLQLPVAASIDPVDWLARLTLDSSTPHLQRSALALPGSALPALQTTRACTPRRDS